MNDSNAIYGVGNGIYRVDITDMKNCLGVYSFELTQPDELVFTNKDYEDISCRAYDDGYIHIDIGGGTKPYNYLWGSQRHGTRNTEDINNLFVDIYDITVTDHNDCVIRDTFELVKQDSVHMHALLTDYKGHNVSCYSGEDGGIQVFVDKGEAPYDYIWQFGELDGTNTIENLPAGDYHVRVKDGRDCLGSLNITLNEPGPISTEAVIQEIVCYGDENGEITVRPSGGTYPYTYEWPDSVESINEVAYNLKPGYYFVNVIDANTCEYDTLFRIKEIPELKISLVVEKQPSCEGEFDGILLAVAEGGMGGYEYKWSTEEIFVDKERLGELQEGNYRVGVRDGNGCIEYAFTSLENEFPNCVDVYNSFTPNDDGYNDYWEIDAYESGNEGPVPFFDKYENAKIKIYNRWGKMVKEIKSGSLSNTKIWDGTDENGNLLPYDTYYYIIELGIKNKQLTGTITIIR